MALNPINIKEKVKGKGGLFGKIIGGLVGAAAGVATTALTANPVAGAAAGTAAGGAATAGGAAAGGALAAGLSAAGTGSAIGSAGGGLIGNAIDPLRRSGGKGVSTLQSAASVDNEQQLAKLVEASKLTLANPKLSAPQKQEVAGVLGPAQAEILKSLQVGRV
jgi:hypothetical protein